VSSGTRSFRRLLRYVSGMPAVTTTRLVSTLEDDRVSARYASCGMSRQNFIIVLRSQSEEEVEEYRNLQYAEALSVKNGEGAHGGVVCTGKQSQYAVRSRGGRRWPWPSGAKPTAQRQCEVRYVLSASRGKGAR